MKKIKQYEELQFIYEDETEKQTHSELMKKQGYEVSPKDGILIDSEFHLCGIYFKYYD